jgi:hypothetical protein
MKLYDIQHGFNINGSFLKIKPEDFSMIFGLTKTGKNLSAAQLGTKVPRSEFFKRCFGNQSFLRGAQWFARCGKLLCQMWQTTLSDVAKVVCHMTKKETQRI